VPAVQPADTPEEPTEMMGLTLSPVSDELRAELDLPAGAIGLVVMDVDEASEAFEKGMRAGDLITEAGQQKVEAVSDLTDRIDEAREAGRKSLLLLVRRGGDPRFVALSLD
jgi:serine protease Do